MNVGGDINLSETAGPTNFTSVSGVEVIDTTQGWHYVATGVALASGTASIPVSNAVVAGDAITVILANVTNPPAATISDFKVSTTADGVAMTAAPYSDRRQRQPGRGRERQPLHHERAGHLLDLQCPGQRGDDRRRRARSPSTRPSGTVFPNSAGFYGVQDATTPSGSAAASAVVSGGGTNRWSSGWPTASTPGTCCRSRSRTSSTRAWPPAPIR